LKEKIDWQRSTSLYSKGLNQEEIAPELHVDQSTVSRDLQFIKKQESKLRNISERISYSSICDIWPDPMK